jgi:hypothetical protein
MKKLFFLTIYLYCFLNGFAKTNFNIDTTRPEIRIRATNGYTDSNVLIVINGKVAGTIRDLNKDINSLIPPDNIDNIHVLKGDKAFEKYGDKGKSGVLEINLKNVIVKDTTTNPINENEEVKIFEKVEVEAFFSGGEAAWRRYLERNLNASIPANNGAPAGVYTVVIQFVVDREGVISDIRPLTKHGYGMEGEVMRVIQNGPKWSPAILNGKPVKAYRKQPVTFMVIEESPKKKKKERI